MEYRAFCAGSIISADRILTSANCFLTNRKKIKHNLDHVKIVAGILHTLALEPVSHEIQQWRQVQKVYSQKYYRFPAYDLAVVKLKKAWIFNQWVNKIAYASMNQNYDGICTTVSVKPTISWATSKFIFSENLQLMSRRHCERTLLRSCGLYYCTQYNYRTRYAFSETQGSGLVCHGTGDPEEKDDKIGLLVGVTSLINIGLPSLHTRVGSFHKWVTDDACMITGDGLVVLCCICLIMLNKLL